jgi:hypothetical protein
MLDPGTMLVGRKVGHKVGRVLWETVWPFLELKSDTLRSDTHDAWQMKQTRQTTGYYLVI